jgi:hypothetical protein
MAIIVKGGGDFVPAPEGLHNACCVDVVDLGDRETTWGLKHKVMLIWEIAAKMEDGKPFTVRKWYTASLNEKSNLYKDLCAWRGRPFTAQELKGFDIENVLGAPCQVFVQHSEKDGQAYGNVSVVTKAPTGPKLKPSEHYVRVKDRKVEEQQQHKPGQYKPEQRKPQPQPCSDFDEPPDRYDEPVPAEEPVADPIPF